MTLEEMRARIDAIEAIIDPLEEELADLNMQVRAVLAAEWIAANGVTRDNVQLTTYGSPDIPWLPDIGEAQRWIHAKPVKYPFVAWNDCIYPLDDFMAGRICWDAPARLSDLK